MMLKEETHSHYNQNKNQNTFYYFYFSTLMCMQSPGDPTKMQIPSSLRWGLRFCIPFQLPMRLRLLHHGPYIEQQGSGLLVDATIGKRNEGDENCKGDCLLKKLTNH